MAIDVRERIELSNEQLEVFCRKWKIARLELFGSALRDDFSNESDIDLLYSLRPEAGWSLFDHVHAEEELGEVLGRRIDLVSRRAVEETENWIRRKHILGSAELIYAA